MPSKARQDFWEHARSFAGRNGPGGIHTTEPPTTPLTLPANAGKRKAVPAKKIKYKKQGC